MDYLSSRTDALLIERKKREAQIAEGSESFAPYALKKINAQFDALVSEMHEISDNEPTTHAKESPCKEPQSPRRNASEPPQSNHPARPGWPLSTQLREIRYDQN